MITRLGKTNVSKNTHEYLIRVSKRGWEKFEDEVLAGLPVSAITNVCIDAIKILIRADP